MRLSQMPIFIFTLVSEGNLWIIQSAIAGKIKALVAFMFFLATALLVMKY
tara:strand:+ start:1298 stop:1447 length:150 start_codon:yes stop_codon:yes gene_type:complete